MSLTKRVLIIAGVVLLALVAADAIGVAACLFFDVVPLRRSSNSMPYAIWLVLGTFVGALSYNFAGDLVTVKVQSMDWWDYPDRKRIGALILRVQLVLLTLLSAVFYRMYWAQSIEWEGWVPDDAGVTVTYFLSVFVGAIAAHTASRPAKRA